MKNYLSVREIKQLPKDSAFNVRGMVSRLNRRKDKNNNPFWELVLSDSTGDLEGKVWSASTWWNSQNGEQFPIDPDNCDLNFEGASVELGGTANDYREQRQYNFENVYYIDQKEFPPHTFARQSVLGSEFLETSFKGLITSITYKPLRNFMRAVFFRHGLWEKFKLWPAAVSIHHAYVSGLLEHSVSVAELSRDIATHYAKYDVPLNMNLIIAGALLHDIGKVEAYAPPPSGYMTVAGNVIEHVSLGYNMFMRYAELEKLDDDVTLALAHIILSHHGKREYGSPITPATPEAMIVSAADELDFKLTYWKTQIESIAGNSELTDYLPLIDRKLWRGISPK